MRIEGKERWCAFTQPFQWLIFNILEDEYELYLSGGLLILRTDYDSQVYYNNANVRQVDVPSFSGAFGILPNHVPTLAVLKPGVVTVVEQDGQAKKFFVSSGSVTVNEDSSGKQKPFFCFEVFRTNGTKWFPKEFHET